VKQILKIYWTQSKFSSFEDFSLENLNNSLKSFYVGARKTDRNHSKISALQNIRYGIKRYLKEKRKHDIDIAKQYCTCTGMCFLGFIRYNKTCIACGFRKYKNVFTHEYHIPLGCCPQGIRYAWVNTFSYFPHQYAINANGICKSDTSLVFQSHMLFVILSFVFDFLSNKI